VKEFPCCEFMSFCVYFCLENLFCWDRWHLGVARLTMRLHRLPLITSAVAT
jgi:hypothetical protein